MAQDDVPPSRDDDVKPIDHETSPVFHDPIIAQQMREKKEDEARRNKVRQKDGSVPDHMIDHVAAVGMGNAVGKGEYIDLLAKLPSLRILYAGVGWSQKAQESEPVDIDLSIFLLDRKGQTRRDEDFVFYNQLTACDGAVRHEGDSRSGAGDGDDESAFIDLNGLPFDVMRIAFVLSIYDEEGKGDHFGLIRDMHFRLVNKEDNVEICRFALPEGEYENTNVIQVAALIREGPKWVFETLGTPMGRTGLAGIATGYGIIVREVQSTG